MSFRLQVRVLPEELAFWWEKHALSTGGSKEENMVYFTELSSEPNLRR